MSRTAVERNFSDFLRNSGDVLSEVAERDVLLRRRDGDDVMLVRADRDATTRDAVDLSSGFMRWLVRTHPDDFLVALQDVIPWVHFLPPVDRASFAAEFLETISASASLDSYAQLAVLLEQWKNTAYVWSQPELARELQRDRGGSAFDEPVGLPEA